MKKSAFWYGLFGAFFLVHHAYAVQSPHSATELEIISSAQNVTTTDSLDVLVKITPQNGWHIYWNNPGDAGMPIKISLVSDFGQTRLKNQSTPKHFQPHPMIAQYAYDSTAYWLFEVLPNIQNFKLGDEISIQVEATWMACKDECVTEHLKQTMKLPVENRLQPYSHWETTLFQAQKTFPKFIQKGYFYTENNILRAVISDFDGSDVGLRFIPYDKDILSSQKPVTYMLKDKHLFIEASLQDNIQIPNEITAVLLTRNGSRQVTLSSQVFMFPSLTQYSFSLILLMAFTGGLILNLMPCIFPILFLKALQLINSAYSGKRISIESLLYFCGVLVSFFVIAAILWVLRQTGESIGWGFQLQSPLFIAFLFILFFFLGLMFLGVLNFNMPIFNQLATLSVENHKLDAFLTGLFAVLIASPCSAPFMGVAIGYSITQPLYIYFPIFIALAVGYALPFTLIGLFPQQLAHFLPRPGKWMVTLKKIFALPVFATCIWLAWIFYYQTIHPSVMSDKAVWNDFSEQQISELQQKNQPIFIDFTAKWCLTCLVNEKTTLSSSAFYRLVKTKNITLFKADWTNQDDQISQALNFYGRNSVPLYIYYDGRSEKPVILPQLLTPSILKQYFK